METSRAGVLAGAFVIVLLSGWTAESASPGQVAQTEQGPYFPKKEYTPKPLPKFSETRSQLPSPIYEENPLYVQMYWKTWEKSCIYQPWLVEHEGKFYDFYNAAQGGVEQTGLALSTDLLSWKRYSGNPIIQVRPKGYDEQFASDSKVFRDGDHWAMFYFGVGRGGAHIMVAFSRDLLHWTAHPEPLYKTA